MGVVANVNFRASFRTLPHSRVISWRVLSAAWTGSVWISVLTCCKNAWAFFCLEKRSTVTPTIPKAALKRAFIPLGSGLAKDRGSTSLVRGVLGRRLPSLIVRGVGVLAAEEHSSFL